MITHDLGVIADIADRVVVMYAGKPMEYADKRTLYHQPHHPYTEGLIGSLPQQAGRGERLKSISGLPPSMVRLPRGCPFHPRCAYAMDRCLDSEPPVGPVSAGVDHRSACFLPPEIVGAGPDAAASRAESAERGGVLAEPRGAWGSEAL
jgi:oligopeptide/dipeptide ABC transporter ATP-binding protein